MKNTIRRAADEAYEQISRYSKKIRTKEKSFLVHAAGYSTSHELRRTLVLSR